MHTPFSNLCLLLATVGVAGAREWKPVACPRADPPLIERVRPLLTLEDFESSTPQWTAHNGGQNAKASVAAAREEKHAGQGALAVDYEFVGKPEYEYVAVGRSLAIPTNAAGVGFWLKRGPMPSPMAVRIEDRSGEVHQFGVEEAPGDGWHYAAALFRAGESWGGDGNHRLDPPLRLHALVFDRSSPGFRAQGRLWIDDVQAVQPAPEDNVKSLRIEVANPRFGNMYRPGETVELRATAAEGNVGWRVEDFWGATLALQPASQTDATVTFRLPRPGHYVIAFDSLKNGGVVESREFRLAALEENSSPATNGFTGFCTHFGQNAYPLESMDLLKRYGFRRYRDEISWSSVERERGRYALPDFAARYLAHSKALGLEPLIIFDYANKLYDDGAFPNSPESIAAFAAYSVELAKLTRDTVKEFEIWNEWIGGCGMNGRAGDHGPEAYGRLMKPTAAAVRAARPDATLVGIGGEYGPHCAENIERALRTGTGQNLDAFSIHPYRYPRSPESSDLVGEIKRIFEHARKFGAPAKMWVTEIGYPTHRGRGGVDERTQARYAVRTLALLHGSGVVDAVHWYDFKDDGLERGYNEHNFGVVLHQQYHCAPKPAAVAVSVFARMTTGAKPLELQNEGGFHTLRYRRADGSDLLVLWQTEGQSERTIRGEDVAAFDLMGAALSPGRTIQVSASPLYLAGRDIRVQP